MNPMGTDRAATVGLRLVVMLGAVSLLSDMTYEGARSVSGPFLASLGAGAVVVATFAGLGELIGYGLRLVSGYLTERSGRPWLVMLVGYSVNLLAVPALALAGAWPAAVALLMVERLGKGVRSPARDALLAHATARMGRGWGYGLHEAMDQVGAVVGPLVVAAVLLRTGSFRTAFAALLLPALLALTMLLVARRAYPRPEELEPKGAVSIRGRELPPGFWVYVAGAACLAGSFADYPLLAFHFVREGLFAPATIPVLYAAAMGVDAVAALVLGNLFDRHRAATLVGAALLSAAAVPLTLLGGRGAALAGMALWATGLGAQESVLRAAVADLVPAARRASAFGIFHGVFGLAWFLGSLAMGLLYQVSLPALAGLSALLAVAAAPMLAAATRTR